MRADFARAAVLPAGPATAEELAADRHGQERDQRLHQHREHPQHDPDAHQRQQGQVHLQRLPQQEHQCRLQQEHPRLLLHQMTVI